MTADTEAGNMGHDTDSSNRTAPPGAPAPDSGGAEVEIWGPRSFKPFKLGPRDEREGGSRAWIDRVLIGWYFLQHENEPTPMAEICEWTEALTPDEILDAIATAVTIGYP